MGNRAVITTHNPDRYHSIGIYLHWNGGVESVLAFLEAARQFKIRGPINDDSYCFARLAQMIGNFFGGTTSIGINTLNRLDVDNGDNGCYEINDDFQIITRTGTRSNVCQVDQLSDEDKKKYEAILADVLKKNAPFFTEGF